MYLNYVANGKGTQGIRTITIIESITKSDAADKVRYLTKKKWLVNVANWNKRKTINQTNYLYQGLTSNKVIPDIGFKNEVSTTVVITVMLQLLKYFYRCKWQIQMTAHKFCK